MVARRGIRISCRHDGGFNWTHAREIPETYGGPNPCQARRHGTDGQRALARPLSAQWNGDEYLHGSQKNRQMASRAEPALHRVRKRADTEMLRRLALRQTSRAATGRSFAVAGHPRAVERPQLNRTAALRMSRQYGVSVTGSRTKLARLIFIVRREYDG